MVFLPADLFSAECSVESVTIFQDWSPADLHCFIECLSFILNITDLQHYRSNLLMKLFLHQQIDIVCFLY